MIFITGETRIDQYLLGSKTNFTSLLSASTTNVNRQAEAGEQLWGMSKNHKIF